MNRTVVIDENLCTGCGTCIDICPKKILYIDPMEHVCRVTDETKCDRRGGCEFKCTAGAIKIYK